MLGFLNGYISLAPAEHADMRTLRPLIPLYFASSIRYSPTFTLQ